MESLNTQVLLDRVICPFIHRTKMTVWPHPFKDQAKHLLQWAKHSPPLCGHFTILAYRFTIGNAMFSQCDNYQQDNICTDLYVHEQKASWSHHSYKIIHTYTLSNTVDQILRMTGSYFSPPSCDIYKFSKIPISLVPPHFQVLPTLWLKYFSNFTLASSTHWVQLRGLLLSVLITWKQPSKLSPDFIL